MSKIQVSEKVCSETVWKSEWSRSMTYAPEHEKKLPDGSIQRRMGIPRALRSGSQQARTTENPQQSRDPKRHLLRFEERLRLAAFAARLSVLGDCLLVV